MADSMEGVVKARKSCDNVASNGGLDSTYMIPNEQSVFHNETQRQIIANREDRESLVLWKRPIVTLQYFIKELCIDLYEFGINILMYYKLVILFILVLAVCILTYHAEGPHQKYVALLEKKFFWCAYWVGLGVLSSVGLGTGLHTFVLYLGPHIASVTLAAYECNSLNFPEPPYPDEIICPEEESGSGVVSILKIMSKVRLEAFMWGAGTALGELPPYFMAKAARLSGQDNDDEELKEFTELLQQRKNRPEEQSFIDGAKLTVQKLVEKVGFFGILACASMTVHQIINFTVSVFVLCLIQIPNPLFDLAGITCGHFLVPFWTFFGATLLGKAIIKTHIQKLFVIVAFNENQVHTLVEKTKYVPYIGKYLHAPLHDFLLKQKEKLHRKVGSPGQSEGSWLSWMYQKFVIAMVAYFVISIVNSIAQSHHKRLTKNQNRARSKLATD